MNFEFDVEKSYSSFLNRKKILILGQILSILVGTYFLNMLSYLRRESEESGGTDTMSDTPDVDLFQLQMNTLRFPPSSATPQSFFQSDSIVLGF
jgi:hypothetical protein